MYPNYVTVSVYFCTITSALSGKEKEGSSVMEIRLHRYTGYTVKRLHRYTGTGIKVHRYIDIKQFRYTYDRTRQLMTERVCIFTRFYHEISQSLIFIIFSQMSCYGCLT